MNSVTRPFHTDPIRYVTVLNTESTTVPPFGMMRITSIQADGIVAVSKPTADNQTNIIVNGSMPIPAGEKGQASFTFPAVIGFDASGDNPAIGDEWGTQSGKWYLQFGKSGFEILATQQGDATNPTNRALVDRLYASNGDSNGGGGSGCCSDEIAIYHPTTAPFTTTCDIRRPFGAGAATTSNVSCTLWGDFAPSRLSTDAIDWTHVMVVPFGTDIRDGLTRLIGSNALGYADGDEVRIPSGASSPRFVVVWVESVDKGGSNPYYRVFMMRHTA